MKILVTGCAGFIGFHLCNYLAKKNNYFVYGIDNLNNYYDISLKKKRLNILKKKNNFLFKKIDIIKENSINTFFKNNKIDIIYHLAAQAGVRYSISSPRTYLESNIVGFFNILEVSRKFKIKHLLFASSSSVYGTQNIFPLKEDNNTDKPDSFYAATKKSNEVMAYSYSNIYNLKVTALRFFTVYGPFGRPDMALFKFSQNILKNKKIDLYNRGNHERDFTFIDDVVYKIYKLLDKPSKKLVPYQVFNIGNGKPEKLSNFIKEIERSTKLKAKKNLLPFQKGDVHKTHASTLKINKILGKNKKTTIKEGISKFIIWFKKYYI